MAAKAVIEFRRADAPHTRDSAPRSAVNPSGSRTRLAVESGDGAARCRSSARSLLAYCLMPNHVHLIAVPQSADGLRRAIGEVHRRYTRTINFREGWRGHLWQGRFASYVLDEPYLLTAARYVELNPVRRAGRGTKSLPVDSAAAHVRGKDDTQVRVAPLLKLAPNWRAFLARVVREEDLKLLRGHGHTGRPLGVEEFLTSLERDLGRILRRQKPGPKGMPRR